MTPTIITVAVLLAFAALFFVAFHFWKRWQNSESDKFLLEVKLRNKNKQAKQKIADFDELDLGLATTKQIIEEMRKRPNNRFLILIPHQKSEDIYVETHICNIAPEAVLMMLKVAYDGVSEAWDENDDDWDVTEDE